MCTASAAPRVREQKATQSPSFYPSSAMTFVILSASSKSSSLSHRSPRFLTHAPLRHAAPRPPTVRHAMRHMPHAALQVVAARIDHPAQVPRAPLATAFLLLALQAVEQGLPRTRVVRGAGRHIPVAVRAAAIVSLTRVLREDRGEVENIFTILTPRGA